MRAAWIGSVAVGILAGTAPNALAAVSQVQAAPQEAAQGGATVALTFAAAQQRVRSKVVCRDDGRPFDLADLSGENGGALQIRALIERHGGEGGLVLECGLGRGGGNLYTFKFGRLTADLRAARRDCRVTIERGFFGGTPRGLDGLAFDLDCRSVYIDARNVVMVSRALDLTRAVQSLLESGRGVYLACHDEEDAHLYRKLLKAHAGPKLRIFIAGRE